LIATLEATRARGETAFAAAAELQSLAQEVQDLAEPSHRKQSGQGGVR
jgi:hypothetical protein